MPWYLKLVKKAFSDKAWIFNPFKVNEDSVGHNENQPLGLKEIPAEISGTIISLTEGGKPNKLHKKRSEIEPQKLRIMIEQGFGVVTELRERVEGGPTSRANLQAINLALHNSNQANM